jgi:hypothetical protein
MQPPLGIPYMHHASSAGVKCNIKHRVHPNPINYITI